MATETPAQFDGTLKVSTFPNRFNTVIPPEGPFYRTGLVITDLNDVPLIEGMDYYLGYYYKEAAEAFQAAVFGGIMLLNHDAIKYSIYAVGRDYRVPQSEIGKWLVSSDMKDPRNEDWSALMRFAPTIPAIDPPQDLDEAIARDDIVAALNDIRLGLIKRAGDMDAAYGDVTDLIYQTGKKVFDDGMYQHHLLKSQGHSYTAEDIGALKVTDKAVDATRAFGRTIDQLVTLMSTTGFQQKHLDLLMRNDTAFNNVFGRLRVLNNNVLTYTTANSDHVVTFKGPNVLVSTKKTMRFTADSGNANPGLAVEMSAGLNTLMVHSGPNALAPVFNGVYLITPDMVELYLHEVKLKAANAYMSSTETVKVYGSGKSYAPFRLEANLPEAAVGVRGLIKVTSNRTTLSEGYAISQAGITAMRDLLGNYVDDAYTINGKGFDATQTLTLTATDVGVDKMQNTAPVDKPVTKALTSAVANKSLTNHTHTLADVTDVPYASSSAAGLVLLWDIIDASTDRVVTARQGYLFEKALADLESKANGLIPAWAVIGASYGNLGFLPIPALGNYEGYGKNNSYYYGAMRFEGDKLYILRNGTDGLTDQHIYYAYGTLNEDNTLTNVQQTTQRYQPAGMTAKYPGVTLKAVVVPGNDFILCLGSDNAYYLVDMAGTADHNRHLNVVRVTFPSITDVAGASTALVPVGETDDIVVYGSKVYLLRTRLANDSYRVALASVSLNAFGGQDIAFAMETLNGMKGVAGSWLLLRAEGAYDPDNANTDRVAYMPASAAAIWTVGKNLVHGPACNRALGLQDEVLRVGMNPTLWLAKATESVGFSNWYTSYTLDFDTLTVALERPEIFPLQFLDTGPQYKTGTDLITAKYPAKWTGTQANARAYVAHQGTTVAVLSAEGDRDTPIRVSTMSTPDGDDYYDSLAADVLGVPAAGSVVRLDQGRGSVYASGMAYPLFFGGDSKAIWLTGVKDALAVEVVYSTDTDYGVPGYGGFGPTNNRREITPEAYAAMSQLAMVKVSNADKGTLNGCFFTKAETVQYKNVAGNPNFTADKLTLNDTEWAKVRSILLGNAPAGAANGYASERLMAADQIGKLYVGLWGFAIGTQQQLFLGQATAQRLVNGVNKIDHYYFVMYPSVSNGQLAFSSTTVQLLSFHNDLDYNIANVGLDFSYSGKPRRFGQPQLISTDGQKFALMLPMVLRIAQVGNAAGLNYAAVLTLSGNQWAKTSATVYTDNPTYQPNTWVWVKDLNAMVRSYFKLDPVFASGDAYAIADFMAKPLDTSVTSQPVVLAGVKTAEGWVLYLTEDERLFINSQEYLLDQYSIDFSSAFSDYRNQTFYFHAEVYPDEGTFKARYRVSTTRYPDSDNLLYIGYVKTDSSRIVEENILPVKRLGDVRQLMEHEGVGYSHGSNVGRELAESPLGLLEPLPIATSGNGFVGQSALSAAIGTLLSRPLINRYVPAQQAWYSGAVLPELFWAPARAVAVTSAENPDANTLGLIWIDIYQRSIPNFGTFGTKFKVTTTGGTLRIRFAVDDMCHIYIDGVRVASGITSGGANQLATQDFPVSNGQHTVAIEVIQAGTAGGTICHIAFIAYDWNGTTARELTRSSGTSVVAFTSDQGTASGNLGVLETISHVYVPVTDNTAVVTVVAPEISYAPPFIERANGSNREVVVASKFFGPDGKLVTLGEVTVNLMLIPTSNLSS